MGLERSECSPMADPMQIPHSVLIATTARRRRSTTVYNVRWWLVAAILFFIIYGSIFVLIRAMT